MTVSRREFLGTVGAGLAAAALRRPALRALGAAQGAAQGGAQGVGGAPTTMSGPMDGDRYRPVRRPPKAPVNAVLSAAQRDELEHHIHCQCGCTLDVYTCRTTDFTCPVSPAMHQDVVQLAAGGYSGAEILAAFRETYGDRVLMAPAREGFNWAAYLAPFLALGAGAASLVVVLRRWKKPDEGRGSEAGSLPTGPAATPEELARLDAAIRDDAR